MIPSRHGLTLLNSDWSIFYPNLFIGQDSFPSMGWWINKK
jgi:hypothetical protein